MVASAAAQCHSACATCSGPAAGQCIVAGGWTQQTSAAPFVLPNVGGSMVVSATGRLVLLGGYSVYDSVLTDDVYSSSDLGATWTTVNTAAFGGNGLALHTCAVLSSNRVVCFGGRRSYGGSFGNTAEVYHSDDEGATVTLATSSPAGGISARRDHSMVVLSDDTLVVCGGYATDYLGDCWYSNDAGVSWGARASSTWLPRHSLRMAVTTADVIVLTGGHAHNVGDQQDVWKSADGGETWTRVANTPPWAARILHTLWAVGDVLVLAGGFAGGQAKNEMWISEDAGVTWSPRGNAPWPARYQAASATTSWGAMVMAVGGAIGTTLADVWMFDQFAVCDPACATCRGPAATDCVSCAGGNVEYQGACAPAPQVNVSAAAAAALGGDGASPCTRGMVAVAQLRVAPVNSDSRVSAYVQKSTGADLAPFTLRRDALDAALFHLELRKAVDPGAREVHVVVTEAPRTGANVTIVAPRVVRLLGNVSCISSAPVAPGAATSVAMTRTALRGVDAALFTTAAGADARKAAFALAVARALGVNVSAVAAVEATGDADGVEVLMDVRLPTSALATSKQVNVALDAGGFNALSPQGERRLQKAMEHAGRTISRSIGVCCQATVVELA